MKAAIVVDHRSNRERETHQGPLRRMPATNKAVTFEGMVFWPMANGKIAERWRILDTASMMRQLKN